MFFGAPGRRLIASLGTDAIRGAHTAFGSGWVVAGSQLFKVAPNGAAVPIGAILGTGRVHMDNNDTQLVIMHSDGWQLLVNGQTTILTVANAPTTA